MEPNTTPLPVYACGRLSAAYTFVAFIIIDVVSSARALLCEASIRSTPRQAESTEILSRGMSAIYMLPNCASLRLPVFSNTASASPLILTKAQMLPRVGSLPSALPSLLQRCHSDDSIAARLTKGDIFE